MSAAITAKSDATLRREQRADRGDLVAIWIPRALEETLAELLLSL